MLWLDAVAQLVACSSLCYEDLMCSSFFKACMESHSSWYNFQQWNAVQCQPASLYGDNPGFIQHQKIWDPGQWWVSNMWWWLISKYIRAFSQYNSQGFNLDATFCQNQPISAVCLVIICWHDLVCVYPGFCFGGDAPSPCCPILGGVSEGAFVPIHIFSSCPSMC